MIVSTVPINLILNNPDIGAVKVALEFNVYKKEAQGSAEDKLE